ncbi:hypothetical protein ACVWZX_003136 [Deinococcus sp. UYEF24]
MTVKKLLTAILTLALAVGSVAGAAPTKGTSDSSTSQRVPPDWGN